MWIEELPNGKFKAVERYDDYLTGKSKKVSVTLEKNTARARKTAQAALTEKIKKALSKTCVKKDYTFKEISHLYLHDLADEVKQTTYYEYSCTISQLMLILGENTVIDRINANYVKTAFKSSDKRTATLNTYLIHFKRIIRWAYKNDYIENIQYLDKLEPLKEPASRIPVTHTDSCIEEAKYLEASEINKLISSMKSKIWRDMTEFLVLTGLRFGEAAALTISDIDLKNRLIYITKNYSSKQHLLSTPKTERSNRQIYIQDELLELCKSLKREAMIQRLASGSDLIFSSKRGAYVTHTTYYRYLIVYSRKYLQKEITPHALRHTHGSLLLEQGMSIDAISRRLGHEDTATTTRIYLHVTQKLKEKEYEKIKEIKII